MCYDHELKDYAWFNDVNVEEVHEPFGIITNSYGQSCPIAPPITYEKMVEAIALLNRPYTFSYPVWITRRVI
jgi:hypothetical protein